MKNMSLSFGICWINGANKAEQLKLKLDFRYLPADADSWDLRDADAPKELEKLRMVPEDLRRCFERQISLDNSEIFHLTWIYYFITKYFDLQNSSIENFDLVN